MGAVADPGDRRRFQRISLPRPVGGRAGAARVFLVDLSLGGFRVAHQMPLKPSDPFELSFEWEGQRLTLRCTVMHNVLFRLARTSAEKSIYHAGLRIEEASVASRAALRDMIASFVARALDEQKANARGIPATAADSFQTGKGTRFLRCELINGAWRRSETERPDQPAVGFTVSVEENREQLALLCDSFEKADPEGRKMIQMLAEMSISKAEGIPTRRYTL
jgi:hypothetical protein